MGPSASDVLEAPEVDEGPVDAGQQRGEAKQAAERVDIPAGRLVAGSKPGDRGRDPALEPAMLEVTLNAFAIDRLPYPNDPSLPPRTGVDRAQAAALCAERGGRLCTELEWERACKGPEGQSYAGSAAWNEACAKEPQTCASGFDVLAMGALREWTASDVQPIKKWLTGGAAVRGAPREAADVDHRCAHRAAVADKASGADLTFRCCYGEANTATVASPTWLGTMRRAEMPSERLQELFAGDAQLKDLSKDIKYFRRDPGVETVRRRGQARGMDGGAPPPNTEMITEPHLWNPVPGEELLLVTGKSGKDSFIVAFHVLPGDRYRVGSALIMKDEPGPVVLVYNPFVRRKLHWTTCWECYGETGNITYRDENRVVITQR